MRRPPAVDAVVAVALLAVVQVELWMSPDVQPHGVFAALAVALTLPLAWRRRAPLAVMCLVGAAMSAWAIPGVEDAEGVTTLAPMLLAAYSAGAHPVESRAHAGLGAIFATALAVPLLGGNGLSGDAVFIAVLLGAPWLGGRAVAAVHEQEARLRELAARLEAERERGARLAVATERRRIAAELNDAVAHCVGAMVVQAGAAAETLPRDPVAAREPLRAVQNTGREAVGELRRMLGLLRQA